MWLLSPPINNTLSAIVHAKVKDEGTMTSNSKISLNEAIAAMEKAYAKLAAAAELAALDRSEAAVKSEASQAELTASWQTHSQGLETSLTQAASENEFLKADNLRLSNQLQQLQQDYLELQRTAGDIVGRLDSSVNQLDSILEH